MTRQLRIAFLPLICAAQIVGTCSAQTPPKTVQERLGYPASARLLIIHADYLGMDHSVNRATFEALDKGWITSASILVPCPWFPEVVRWAKDHPKADLGIHLALTSEWTDFRWGPVSPKDQVASLLDTQGYLPLDTPEVGRNARMPEVKAELRAQIERARTMAISISHFDMHMAGMVSTPALFAVYKELRDEYRTPILLEVHGAHAPPEGVPVSPDDITIQRVINMEPGVPPNAWIDWYEKQLAALEPGVYQMIVHLAYDDEEMRGATRDHPDWGAAWRQQDLDMVKSAEFQKFLKDQKFILIGWKDLAKASPNHTK